MKIRKKSGELEEFDPGKLESSPLSAGASADLAKRISERIQPSEGLSTDDLRRRVAEELLGENGVLSGAYMSTRRLKVRNDFALPPETARLHAEHMRGLKSDPGVVLSSSGKTAEVRLQPASSSGPREIRLSRGVWRGCQSSRIPASALDSRYETESRILPRTRAGGVSSVSALFPKCEIEMRFGICIHDGRKT